MIETMFEGRDITEISALSDPDRERISRLRLEALNSGFDTSEYLYHFWKRYRECRWMNTEPRYAEALSYMFDNVDAVIGEDELIVGRISNRRLTEEEQAEFRQLSDWTIPGSSSPSGQDSHMAIDYQLLMDKGISGIIEDIGRLRAAQDGLTPDGLKKIEFYDAAEKCLRAVVRFAGRYADEAERLAGSPDTAPGRAAELRRIAADLRQVPENPPKTFRQAVQSAHFVTFCLTPNPLLGRGISQYQLGRPDRYLWKFYKADIEAGRLTPGEARLICDCLAISINRRVPHGLSSGYMVGGRDADGSVVSNDLTRLFIQAVADNRLVYPSVGLCVCREGEATPAEDIGLACKVLAQGCSHPAFFNDDVIHKGLVGYGLSDAEACMYIHSTCVEITPAGSSNVWVASPYHNLPQYLLDVMGGEYSCMDRLLEAYYARLDQRIKEEWRVQCLSRFERMNGCDPLLSCFVSDCLAEGTDIQRGGGRYNWITPSFVGLSNLCDALEAIKTLVFDRKELTLAGLREACENNWEGREDLRQKVLSVEKYGSDCDEADSWAGTVSRHIAKVCEKFPTPLRNGRTIPSMFCWIMHDILGQQTGATPDGRKAGFPLGDGSGPAQGRERRGPTASILSSTKWDHTPFIGGIAVNMKFSKSYMKDGSVDVMRSLAESYLARGGFELQINVTDAETLKKARDNPEDYRDLVVRIGGYSDYFVTLSPTMQAEVIARTEHEI
ncbi:MAG: hypothetical protein K6D94_01445 [Clostridiales bacterium]|nr:hypothetical protein [Clostridiales bacterium]